MDISDTIAPNSDQLDAVDLLSGARTFSIEGVSKGNAEQPVQIHLREFPRPWRPGKSMRRVLVAVWGKDASTYAGKSLTLYCDETVRFGGQAVGGVRISHMSGIDKPRDVPLIISRGKSAIFTVRPLANAPTPIEPTAEQVAQCTDMEALRAWHAVSGPERRAQIIARRDELKGAKGEQP
ncbi:hypothetical protein [Cellulosimicrobium funkei]|uniref:hypothetical protein n=1 Tax=Cellulosimicrobium funkei TaxID=264251 RepID=UPI0036AB84F1